MTFAKECKYKIEEIVRIHNCTKHYIILGEEISPDFETYLQPIKEFRDAYEHLIRCIAVEYDIADLDNDKNNYILNNLDKTLGHEYRAFFDTADWFCVICRDNINNIVSKYTYEEICLKYTKYPEVKKRIFDISLKIADIRSDKDISSDIIDKVNEYQYIMKELLSYYRDLINCAL